MQISWLKEWKHFQNHQTIRIFCSQFFDQHTTRFYKYVVLPIVDMMIIWNSLGASPKLSKSHRKLRSLEKPINATNPIPILLGVGWGNTDTASRKSSCGNRKSWQRLEGDFVVLVGNFSLRPSNVIPNYEVTHKLQVPILGWQILTMEIVFLPLENEGGRSPSSTERRRWRSHLRMRRFGRNCPLDQVLIWYQTRMGNIFECSRP